MRKICFVLGIIAVLAVGAAVTVSVVAKNQKETIKFQRETIAKLGVSLEEAINKTAISFQINPQITNKVTSAFGSNKYVTLQYYFTLDGKAMIVDKADSAYTVYKEY